jgi:transketolase
MISQELAKRIRIHSLQMCHKAKASHIGGCLSCADILAVLYNDVLKEQDKLIVSKGHCAAAVYSCLAEMGKIPMEWLNRYCQDGAELGGHVTFGVNGVEVSAGSLGHGLSIACGMALANKSNIYVLMSDGECDEGSVWEAADFASVQRLSNLTVIIDYNGLKSFSRTQSVTVLTDKWRAFGWTTHRLNGHNIDVLKNALLRNSFIKHLPTCLIAQTIKGNGVSFMEKNLAWHYKSPNDEELKLALGELNAN